MSNRDMADRPCPREAPKSVENIKARAEWYFGRFLQLGFKYHSTINSNKKDQLSNRLSDKGYEVWYGHGGFENWGFFDSRLTTIFVRKN